MSKEGPQPTFETTPQGSIELPQHFLQFIDSLNTIRWINPSKKRPESLLDNENTTYLIYDNYQRATSASGNSYGDQWQWVETEISGVMKFLLGEKEFTKRKFAIRNQALYLAKKYNLRGSFNDDAALYYFYKNYNKNSPNFSYIKNRRNIWCCGYGVSGERNVQGKTIFYCYGNSS